MTQKRTTSTGQMISTVCFVGVGLWSFGTALDAPMPTAIVLGLCSLACFAGASRFLIARFFDK